MTNWSSTSGTTDSFLNTSEPMTRKPFTPALTMLPLSRASPFGLLVIAAVFMGCTSRPPVSKQSEAVLIALERSMDLEVEELPLTDTMDYIGSRHGIDIQFAANALEEVDAPNTAIAYSAKGKPVRQVIAEILKPYGLTYIVDNGVLTIVKAAPQQ